MNLFLLLGHIFTLCMYTYRQKQALQAHGEQEERIRWQPAILWDHFSRLSVFVNTNADLRGCLHAHFLLL